MYVNQMVVGYSHQVLNLIIALVVLLVGWLIAKSIGKAVEKGLRKTNLHHKLFSHTGNPPKGKYSSEVIVGKVVYYILLVIVFIIFLNMLSLSFVATPLVQMISIITGAIPFVLQAALILLLAWVAATVIRFLFKKAVSMFNLKDHMVKWNISGNAYEAQNKLDGFAKAVFYFVLLLFLPGVLGALHIQGVSQPFADTLSAMLSFIPKLFAAAIIVVVGYLIAKIVRDILTNFLSSIGTEKLGQRLGLSKTSEAGGQDGFSISSIIGNIAFVLILIPTIITALERLNLRGISEPAIAMLNQVLTLIPNIVVAIVMILVGIWVGKWVEKLISQMLWRLKFDSLFHQMGIGSYNQDQKFSLSQLVGMLAKIVVVLLFTVEALQIVHLTFLVTLATAVIAYLPMLFAAIVILGIGLYLGHLVERILQNVLKSDYSRPLAAVAKYSIIAISIFMALDQMGVAKSIVNAAFILVLGGMALAFGLAFGLGGKEFAAKYLRKLDKKIEEENNNDLLE